MSLKKRKIVYIWFRSFRCLNGVGVHFSRELEFNVNTNDSPQKKTSYYITITSNKDTYIPNFYSEDVDFSAIVGENGTGKSTVMRGILNIFSKKQKVECIIIEKIFEKDHRKYVVYSNLEDVSVQDNEFSIEKSIVDISKFIEKYRLVYDTQVLNYYDYISSESSDICNMSEGFLLYKQTVDKSVKNYFFQQFLSQIRFVFDDKWSRSFLELLEYNKNQKVLITINTPEFNSIKELKSEFASKFDDYWLLKYKNADFEKAHDEIRLAICNLILNSFIKCIIKKIEEIERKPDWDLCNLFYTSFSDIIEAKANDISNSKYNSIVNTFIKSFEDMRFYKTRRLFPMPDNEDQIIENFMIEIKSLVNSHMSFLKYLRNTVISVKKTFKSESKSIIRLSTNHSISMNGYFDFQIFFKRYEEFSGLSDLFSFEWEGISSGENAVLSLLSKLHQAKKQITTTSKSIIILLDEADMLFHPRWQQRYIELIHNYVRDLFSGIYVQIVIATHSPIMLSDIPRQNVTFLKLSDITDQTEASKEDETFSSNIFHLFQNAFFIDSSGMGLFAENKLKTIVEKIHACSTKEEEIEIKNYILAIGDSYLKCKLEQELNLKLSVNSPEKRLIELQKEIENLKQIIKRKNS